MLQTLVLKKTDFTWFKENKEITINGKLFDVRSFYKENGQYVFKGIYDDDETELNKELNNGINERNNQFLTGIFQLLFSAFSGNFSELAITRNITNIYFPFILQPTSSPFKNILTPPPQVVITYCM